MSVLIAENLNKSYGDQVIFEEVSLVLQPGERVGLLGVNGSGKSTLCKILAGQEAADSGDIRIRKGAKVAYFSQEPELSKGKSVREIAAEGLGEWNQLVERYEQINREMESGENLEALLSEQAEVSAAIERSGGWERSHQVDSVLEHLGVTRKEALASELSGGEKRRVALARLLLSQPDLAILDEPTNHLDIETIEWLENYLCNEFKGALLFITHDRYMLDRVAQRIVEIDRNQAQRYKGGWEDYLEAKAERLAHEERTEANRQNFLRHELEWLSRSPQARTTKQKARIKRVEAVRDQGGPKKQAEQMQIKVQEARSGKTILDIQKLQLSVAGKTLIHELDLCLAKGDRIGIVGRNGTGKTSLLRAILGELNPVSGQVVLGETMKVGYFEQARANLDFEASIFENVIGNRSDIHLGDEIIGAYAYLERFQFSRRRARDAVKLLSGGERARVALAKMLIDPVNLLLLDEPTNDLDVATLSSLEDMLVATGASALVVTHDRYFLDRVATGVLLFEGEGKVTRYASAHQALLSKRNFSKADKSLVGEVKASPKPLAAKAEPSPKTSPGKKNPSKGLTYGERIEYETILEKVASQEELVAEIEAELADPTIYSQRGSEVPQIQARLEQAQTALLEVVERWEYLEGKLEQ